LNRVCQVEVADVYEHKHKPLSAGCAAEGLHRMAVEVGAALVRAAAPASTSGSAAFVSRVESRYRQIATQILSRYRADARLNGLAFDDTCEHQAISVFAGALTPACAMASEAQSTCLAPWRDIEQAFPRVLDRLRDMGDELDVLKPVGARVPVRTRVGRLLSRRPHADWAPASVLPAEDFA
jgi:glucosyl-3-phosphoglycerate synthase